MATIYRPDTMSASEIKKMQNALISAGYSVGKAGADGIWGKDTAAALSKYKSDTGGSNSAGYSVGNETFRKLYGSSGGSTSSTSSGGTTTRPKTDYDIGTPAPPVIDEYDDTSALNKQIIEMIDAQNAQNQAAIRQRTQQLVNSIKGNQTDINDAYKEAQRQAYINQALQRNQTADYLSANGYTGGMAESTLAQLQANYENNRRNATSERDAALRQNEQLIAEAQASGNTELAELASNYTSQAIAAMQNQAQMNYQINQAKQAQANSDRDYQLALMQYRLSQQRYEDDLAASKADQDFKTFLDTYEGKYNKQSTYEDWIKNLKAKDDPYGYNAQKIAYLTQYINSGMGKSNSQARAAASTGSDTESTRTIQNGPSNVANYDQILKTASLIKSTNSFYGPQGAVDYVEKSGLTDFEKNKAFKALGLL